MRLIVPALLAAVALGGCATANVSSHVERGLDFGGYRTYDWGPADALPSGDPRLDNDPYFTDYVLGAVERGLAARGLERTSASEPPDLLVHYHAHISERLAIDRSDRRIAAGGDAPGVTTYEAGTLVLDVVDRRTNRVIWRGWAQNSVEDLLHDRAAMARTVEAAVADMLERFPRVR